MEKENNERAAEQAEQAILEAVIDAQAAEANTPADQLTDEQLINNRFL